MQLTDDERPTPACPVITIPDLVAISLVLLAPLVTYLRHSCNFWSGIACQWVQVKVVESSGDNVGENLLLSNQSSVLPLDSILTRAASEPASPLAVSGIVSMIAIVGAQVSALQNPDLRPS